MHDTTLVLPSAPEGAVSLAKNPDCEALPESVVLWMTRASAGDLPIFKPLSFSVPLPQIGCGGTNAFHHRAIADAEWVEPKSRAEPDALEQALHAECLLAL